MSKINLKKANYAGWQEAYWIEYGSLTLILVPQVGGRIMGLRWQDRDLYWVPKLGWQTSKCQSNYASECE